MSDPQASRLDGWKAIADHLGRDSRTAQRWHQERGMPVHHVAGGRGGGVFAYRGELDEWLVAGPQRSPPTASPNTPVEPPAAAPPAHHVSEAEKPARGKQRLAAALAVAAVLFVGAASLGLFSSASTKPTAIPTRFELNGTTLSAFGASGDILWTSLLPDADDRGKPRTNLQTRLGKALPVDLNADGLPDVVAAVDYTHVTGGEIRDAEVYSFSSTGDLQWRYRPNRSLTFAGREFGGPWRALAASITAPPDGRVWLSLIHRTWWPSFVVSLDADGLETLAFINVGHIRAIQSLKTPNGRLMLAGGVNNEFMLPALAIFDELGPAVMSPQTPGTAFVCDDCPTARPRMYFLFPRSDVSVAYGEPFVSVTSIEKPDDTGIIDVTVRDQRNVRAVYRLTAGLTPESVAFSDAHWAAHEQLSGNGGIEHPANDCPARREGVVVRIWQAATGWTDVRVKPTFSFEKLD
jgi:hypothetical protein